MAGPASVSRATRQWTAQLAKALDDTQERSPLPPTGNVASSSLSPERRTRGRDDVGNQATPDDDDDATMDAQLEQLHKRQANLRKKLLIQEAKDDVASMERSLRITSPPAVAEPPSVRSAPSVISVRSKRTAAESNLSSDDDHRRTHSRTRHQGECTSRISWHKHPGTQRVRAGVRTVVPANARGLRDRLQQDHRGPAVPTGRTGR